jgi:hypothetical protein
MKRLHARRHHTPNFRFGGHREADKTQTRYIIALFVFFLVLVCYEMWAK